MKKITMGCCLAIMLSMVGTTSAGHSSGVWMYKIKITNITKGTDLSQGLVLTPTLLAVHSPRVHAFELGEPASKELAMLAEGGATGPLSELLGATRGVYHQTTTGGPLLPGASVEVKLPYAGRSAVLSTAAMLLPTNDGFVALDASTLPFYRNQKVTHFGTAYDAGSELNDELCASIPGPHCNGEGYAEAGGEGKIHVHSGLHGVGDLAVEKYDWNNPVVKITIQLVREAVTTDE